MPFLFENKRINTNIKTGKLFQIHGMTDYYLEVTFRYHAKVWCGAIPINSKYQGIDIPYTDEDVTNWTIHCYIELDPAKYSSGKNNKTHTGITKKLMQQNQYLML